MTQNDPLASVLSHILNCERRGKPDCLVRPASKVVLNVLEIMEKNGYIGRFEVVDRRAGGVIKLILLGSINKCGAIKPRFSFNLGNYEKYEKRYLPAKGFGIIIVTTSEGLMVHTESINRRIGGRLLAYCY